jgi:hypothetical protein
MTLGHEIYEEAPHPCGAQKRRIAISWIKMHDAKMHDALDNFPYHAIIV